MEYSTVCLFVATDTSLAFLLLTMLFVTIDYVEMMVILICYSIDDNFDMTTNLTQYVTFSTISTLSELQMVLPSMMVSVDFVDLYVEVAYVAQLLHIVYSYGLVGLYVC